MSTQAIQKSAPQEDTEQLKKVRQAVRRHNCTVTVGDVIADTGLGDYDAKKALDELIRTHESTLRVSNDGQLIYAFGDGFPLREDQSRWRNFLRSTKEVAQTFLKFLFSLIYIYCICIPLPLIVLLLLLLIFLSMIVVIPILLLFKFLGVDIIDELSLSKLIRPIWRFFAGDEERLPLHHRLSNFVFGPPKQKYTINERAKCAQLIRSKDGVITAEDWVFVSGKTLHEAESDLARFTAEFGGNAEITENGTLLYVFEDMMRGVDEDSVVAPPEIWNALEPTQSLFGNESGGTISLVVLGVIYLLLGGWLSLNYITGTWNTELIFQIAIAYIPFAYFLFVFLYPLLRIPGTLKTNHILRKRSVKNAALEALKPLTDISQSASIQRSAFHERMTANLNKFDMPAPVPSEVDCAVDAICDDFGGEANSDTDAYLFESVMIHQKDAQKRREQLVHELAASGNGELVYSSSQQEQDEINAQKEQAAFAELEDSTVLAKQQKKTKSHSDREGMIADFNEERERIFHELERAIQTQDYSDAEEILDDYDPEVVQDETYTDLVRKVRRGSKWKARRMVVTNYLNDNDLTIECPKTLIIVGLLEVAMAVSAFKSSIAMGIVHLIFIISLFIICIEFPFNPLKSLAASTRSKICIAAFIVLVLLTSNSVGDTQNKKSLSSETQGTTQEENTVPSDPQGNASR